MTKLVYNLKLYHYVNSKFTILFRNNSKRLFSAKDKNGVTLWIKVELLVSKVESLCTKIDFKEKYDYGRN